MLKAQIISNGIMALDDLFPSDERIQYRITPVERDFQVDLSDGDGGVLFAATVDPIVEHGVQQIAHLDNYCDNLTAWLCGIRPQGRLEIDRSRFGVAQVGQFPWQSP
ncbi:MAG: hypothetical protein ACREYF_16930 [Gammaproteobacteria bacterium]